MYWKAFLNKNVPICMKCKHFIKPAIYDPVPSNVLYGKCNKFHKINMIGEIEYDIAAHCREDKNKCGLLGDYYSPIKKLNGK